jgi:hypothetical protein
MRRRKEFIHIRLRQPSYTPALIYYNGGILVYHKRGKVEHHYGRSQALNAAYGAPWGSSATCPTHPSHSFSDQLGRGKQVLFLTDFGRRPARLPLGPLTPIAQVAQREHELPCSTATLGKQRDDIRVWEGGSGGGTRTPDTRIMIPLL